MSIVKKLITAGVVTVLGMSLAAGAMAAELTVKDKSFKSGVVTVELPEFGAGANSADMDAVVSVITAKNVANSLQSVIPEAKPYSTTQFVMMFKDSKNPVEASQDFIKGLTKTADLALSKAAQAAGKDLKTSGYYVQCKYNMYTKSPSLVSFTQTTNLYTGGAHDNISILTSNVNMETGKYLSLSEFFVPGSDYKERLEWVIDKAQKSANRLKVDMGMSAVDFKKIKITGEEKFCYDTRDIRGWSLIIFYNPGEVAPVSEGIVSYSIPIGVIFDILDDSKLK